MTRIFSLSVIVSFQIQRATSRSSSGTKLRRHIKSSILFVSHLGLDHYLHPPRSVTPLLTFLLTHISNFFDQLARCRQLARASLGSCRHPSKASVSPTANTLRRCRSSSSSSMTFERSGSFYVLSFSLFSFLNQRQIFRAEAVIDLPRIAVIGNQSAGKSCLVEALSAVRCTSKPLQIALLILLFF